MTLTRATGLLLFLPVPIVLALFVRAPLGLGASLALGVVLMATHRRYARPWATARASDRCLWCGREGEVGPVALSDPLGPAVWSACDDHGARLRGFVGWAERRAPLLKAGILGTLLVLLFVGAAVVAGALPADRYPDAVALFQGGVAISVLPLALLGPRAPAPETARAPFPLHVQALVGTAVVVWLFRIVGTIWLVQALLHARRTLAWP
jgi:hypothetical protein